MDRDYFLPATESSEGARLPSDDVYSFAQQIILNERHIKGIIGKVVPWEACSRNRTAKPWAGTVWALPSLPVMIALRQPDTVTQLLGHILYRETESNKNSTLHLKNV
jgi:hypothetical protein